MNLILCPPYIVHATAIAYLAIALVILDCSKDPDQSLWGKLWNVLVVHKKEGVPIPKLPDIGNLLCSLSELGANILGNLSIVEDDCWLPISHTKTIRKEIRHIPMASSTQSEPRWIGLLVGLQTRQKILLTQ